MSEETLPFDKLETAEAPKPAPQAVAAPPVKPATPATRPPQAPISTAEKAKVIFGPLLAAKAKPLERFLRNQDNAMRFIASVMKSIEKIPELLNCDPHSVMAAFMEAASLGLYPSDFTGDCYVLPYAGKAQFQIGYRGLKTLAHRAGVLRCWTEVVYENDELEEFLGSVNTLRHRRAKGDRGKALGAYACAEVSEGKVVFKYMTEDEIMKIKALSQAKSSKYSPWNSGNDPMKWMWQKTAFKQLAKLIPTTADLEKAVYLDNISERGGYIDNDGGVVEPSFVDVVGDDKIEAGKAKKANLKAKNNE